MMTNAAAPRELSITRLIEASPETVWQIWSGRTGEWWAPRPYTTPIVAFDLRAGGRAFCEMRAPDGTPMPNEGVFLEVVPARRVVFTDAFGPGWVPHGPFMVAIIEFADEGGRTRYTARVAPSCFHSAYGGLETPKAPRGELALSL